MRQGCGFERSKLIAKNRKLAAMGSKKSKGKATKLTTKLALAEVAHRQGVCVSDQCCTTRAAVD